MCDLTVISIVREQEPAQLLCEALCGVMRSAWGMKDLDILPPWKTFLTPRLGGELVVAYADVTPIGYALLTSAVERTQGGEAYLYLDMIGVAPERQGMKIGERLLRTCISIAIEREVKSLRWTFDPLEGANANLYIRKLGGIGVRFYANYYGDLSGSQHVGSPTDRLLVELRTDRPEARRCSPALTVSTNGSESLPDVLPQCIRLLVPRAFGASMRTQDRVQVRQRSAELLSFLVNDRGYVVIDFQASATENAYLLGASTWP